MNSSPPSRPRRSGYSRTPWRSRPASGPTTLLVGFVERSVESWNDRTVHASGLSSLGDRPWLTLIPSAERALGTVEETSPADLHDYNLERIWRWKNAGRAVRNHPLAKCRTRLPGP